MTFVKCITVKGEVVWINVSMIFYITPYKDRYRVYFEDGMSVDVAEFTNVTFEEFLHSLTEK